MINGNTIKFVLFLYIFIIQINEIKSVNTFASPILKSSKTLPTKSYTSKEYFITRTNSLILTPTTINNNGNNTLINNNTTTFNNNTSSDNSTIVEPVPTNWTTGYGTHYGPFPSYPHFSEVGYQPNDVGVGCSDGRPGGDPEWNKILALGVYPAPKIPNHERTVWPKKYTVAVSAAVWNKEDICWKTLKIRNKDKPSYEIEATVVDFCPIGYCNWKDKYLARNADIYGEAGWKALGGQLDDHSIELEIEWPEGVVPHPALTLSSGHHLKTNLLFMTLASSLSIIILFII